MGESLIKDEYTLFARIEIIMFGLQDLRPKIRITQTTVECPVNDCKRSVKRQRKSFKREERFLCPDHKIYISPSTFEYANETDNLLWHNEADLDLLDTIKKFKRESRMVRDRSEDALTWNMFRYLERTNKLGGLLSIITKTKHSQIEMIYWSYFQKEKGTWSELNKARKEFGEHLQRSSEPDLIIVTDKALFFIEAKLIARNNSLPSNLNEYKKYLTGGDQWYNQVFISSYDSVAIQSKKYALLRFWLIGTWMANQMRRHFYLLNLVPLERETDIEARFIPHIRAGGQNHFKRLSWEEIYNYVIENVPDSDNRRKLAGYFQNKTIGYNRLGELQKAFTID